MNNPEYFTERITHRCPDGSVSQLQGTYKPLAGESRAVCETCGPIYGKNGVEHQ